MNDTFPKIKNALLSYVTSTFEEMEESAALRHQERFALLEDSFESATDVDELRVAFEQWHSDHSEDLELEEDVDEMWEAAIGGLLDEEFDDDTEIKRKKTDNDDVDDFDDEDEEEDPFAEVEEESE